MLCLTVLLLAATISFLFLRQWDGDMTVQFEGGTFFYLPAIMLASGQGFTCPVDTAEVPGLEAFLAGTEERFDPASVPADLAVKAPGPVHRMHQYLIALTGLVWRITGVAWQPLWMLHVAAFCVAVLAVYGLFRLAVGPWLGLTGALLFAVAPGVLENLPRLRDFSKAPFILAALLLMGFLLRRPVSRKAHWIVSTLLGVLIGVGLGFRLDLAVCVPAAVMVLTLCRFRPGGLQLVSRSVGLGLFALAFAGASWPVLTVYQRTGTPAHDVMMGYCTDCEKAMGLAPASYERMYVKLDTFTLATTTSYARRMDGCTDLIPNRTARYNEAGQRFIREVVRTFPGDMVARGYASTLWALGYGGVPRTIDSKDVWLRWFHGRLGPWGAFLRYAGVCCAVVVFLYLSVRSLHVAWLTLLLLLYFGSYVNLLFEPRHTFYLAFVAPWFVLFVVGHALAALRSLRVPEVGEKSGQTVKPPASWWPSTKRVAVFSGVTLAMLAVPLYTARAWQHRRVGEYRDRYLTADLEPLRVETSSFDGWDVYRPSAGLACGRLAFQRMACHPNHYHWPFPAEYLMAEFEAGQEGFTAVLFYDSAGYTNGFHEVRRFTAAPGLSGTMRFFFPVYECPGDFDPGGFWERSRFAGIALPEGESWRFKRLHRVRNLEDFPLLLSSVVQPDGQDYRRYQRILPPWCAPEAAPLVPAVWRQILTLQETIRGDAASTAITALEGRVQRNPENAWAHIRLAYLYGRQGQLDKAVDASEAALHHAPGRSECYDLLDRYYRMLLSTHARSAAWRRFALKTPAASYAGFCLGRSLEEDGLLDQALGEYEKARADYPEVAEFHTRTGLLLLRMERYQEAVAALEKAAVLNPMDPAISSGLARAILRGGETDRARSVAMKGLELAFADVRPYLALAEVHEAAGDSAAAVKVCEAGVAALDSDFTHDYDSLFLWLVSALAGDGQRDAALELCRNLIVRHPGDHRVYHRLTHLYDDEEGPEGLVNEWRELAERHPTLAPAHAQLGAALEEAGRVQEAAAAYGKATEIQPDYFDARLGLGRSLSAVGAYGAAVPVFRELLQDHSSETYLRPLLIKALYESGSFDVAREEIEECARLGIELPPALLEEFGEKAGVG